MLAVQDFTRLGSRAFVCSVVYKVYSYYDFGKDIKKIMIKTRLNIFFVFWANGTAKKGRDRSRPFNSLYPTCFRHWDTQISRPSAHIDQII